MIGKLIKQIYKYENVELASGAIVTAQEVVTKEGKVNQFNAQVKVGVQMFDMSLYPSGNDVTYNLNRVPQGVDGQAILEEFVNFVELDIQ